MSIYFKASISTVTRYYDSETHTLEHESRSEYASFDLGNWSALRCIFSDSDDYCGSKRISGVKFVQWLDRAKTERGVGYVTWCSAASLVCDLLDLVEDSDTCKTYVVVDISYG